MARTRLGQNFLIDRGYQQRIVDAVAPETGDTILEIGPGPGEITAQLADRGARVVAVEVDRALAELLTARFAGNPRIEIIADDILKVPLRFQNAKVFGNLPYYITSPILMRLFQHAGQFQSLVVMVQREVGTRVAAEPGSRDYGLLSVTARYYSNPKVLFHIPPGAFRPAPKVHSSLMRLEIAPRSFPQEKELFRLIKASFQMKRKTLANNLRALYGPQVQEAIGGAGLAPGVRAEELSVGEFERLFLLLAGLR